MDRPENGEHEGVAAFSAVDRDVPLAVLQGHESAVYRPLIGYAYFTDRSSPH
jgi:hypothetical protein